MLTRLRSLAVAFAFVAMLVSVARGFQAVRTNTITLEGRTVDALTGAPIPHVTVHVRGFGLGGESVGSPAQIQSGSDGQFRTTLQSAVAVLHLGAGDRLHFFGHHRPLDYGIRNFDVASEVRGQVVTLRLWPASTIEGTVHTDGEPMPGGTVELWRAWETGLGKRWFRLVGGRTQSDPQGNFRLEGVRPGDYLLVARRDESSMSMPVYYPGVDATHLAQVVQVGSGERIRADVRMSRVRSPGRISGSIKGDARPDGMRVELAALDLDGQPSGTSKLVGQSDAQGQFTFTGLPSGRYRLSAWRWPDTGPNRPWTGGSFETWISPSPEAAGRLPRLDSETTWFASALADITGEIPVVGAELRLRPAPRLRGRAVFEGDSKSAALLKGVPIAVRPADGTDIGMIPLGGFDETGAFSTVGLPPGSYILGLFNDLGVKGWSLRAVRLGLNDLLGAPIELSESDLVGLELVFTKQPPRELTGKVMTRDGRPAANASVIVFARDSRLWNQYLAPPAPRRVTRVPTSITGSFRLQLLPGEYLGYATEAYPDDWMTPRYLKSIVALSTPADLSKAGQEVSLTLR